MRGLLPLVYNNLSRHTVVFLFQKKKTDFGINYDPVSKVAQSRQTLNLLLDRTFFCSDYHIFCTGLMQRRWVYILRQIYLWLCCNQVWINMPQLKRIPKGLPIGLTSFSKPPSVPLPHNTSSPHAPHHFSSSLNTRPLSLFLFIPLLLFCVICPTWPPSLYIQ